MNKIYLLIAALSLTVATMAQDSDSWKIYLNKKLLLQTPLETNQPVVYIEKSATAGKHTISIQFKSGDSESDFKRSFFINDAKENTIKKLELKGVNGTVSFNAKDLKAAANSRQTLFIYTTAIPKDPAMAAAVRVRRFLVCKIEWK